MDENKEMIKDFLEKKLKKTGLKYDDDIFENGYVDSLFALELILFLEREFKVKISNRDVSEENFRTIDNISEVLKKSRPA